MHPPLEDTHVCVCVRACIYVCVSLSTCVYTIVSSGLVFAQQGGGQEGPYACCFFNIGCCQQYGWIVLQIR